MEVADKENTPNAKTLAGSLRTTKARFGWKLPASSAIASAIAPALKIEDLAGDAPDFDEPAESRKRKRQALQPAADAPQAKRPAKTAAQPKQVAAAVTPSLASAEQMPPASTATPAQPAPAPAAHGSLAAFAAELFTPAFAAALEDALKPKFSKDVRFNTKKKMDELGAFYKSLKSCTTELADKKAALLARALETERTLAAEIAALAASETELQAQTHMLRAQLDSLQSTLGEAARESTAAQHGQALLHKDLERATANLAAEQAEHARTRAKADALADSLEAARELVRSQGAELSAAEGARSLAEHDRAAEARAHESALAALRASHEAAATELSTRLGAQLAGASERADTLAGALEAERLARAVHASRADSAEEAARTAAAELAATRAQLDAGSAQLSAALAAFASSQAFHEERTRALAADKVELEARAADAIARAATLDGEGRAARAAADAARSALDAARAELAQAQAQTQLAATAAAAADVRAAAAEAACAELRSALDASRAHAATADAALAGERTAHAATASALASTGARLDASEAAATTAASRAAAAEREVAELGEALARARADLATFKANCGVSTEAQLENLIAVTHERDALLRAVADKGALASALAAAEARVAQLGAAVLEGEAMRRAMHNRIQELRGTVRVVARVRPLLPADGEAEIAAGAAYNFAPDGMSLRLRMAPPGVPADETNSYRFTFDSVFGLDASQGQVFDEVATFVQSALDGYAVSLFSYGQTGSGKTHTMQGEATGDGRGIIARAVDKVMAEAARLAAHGWSYSFSATFVEVYNDELNDLLVDARPARAGAAARAPMDGASVNAAPKKLSIVHEAGQTRIVGANLRQVTSAADIIELMSCAAQNRAVASTSMNERSSRSHSVFTLHLRGQHADSREILQGTLNLCDLAGSERLARSHATGDRLKETQAINKSLSALSTVFVALANKQAHVPYRDSKLTYLLQNSFSGSGKTLMIVNLSPTHASQQESLCSLRFAAKVHNTELGEAKRRVGKIEDDEGAEEVAPETRLKRAGTDGHATDARPAKKPCRPTTGAK